MPGWLAKLLPLLLLLALAAQDPTEEYVETFRHGIKALRARGFDDAITDFRPCLELRPNEATCAYNLACAYSLKGDPEPALAWLERAADWGYGYLEGRIERIASARHRAPATSLPLHRRSLPAPSGPLGGGGSLPLGLQEGEAIP